jgi:hypothetical protein
LIVGVWSEWSDVAWSGVEQPLREGGVPVDLAAVVCLGVRPELRQFGSGVDA